MGIFWNLSLAQILSLPPAPAFLLSSAAYPLGDLMLILSITLIRFQPRLPQWFEPLLWMLAGQLLTTLADVLFSGETDIAPLVSNPAAWTTGGLVALVVFKALAYAVSIGAFRGGPTFPALLIGAAIGILAGQLPGLGVTAGVAIGMAAGMASVLRLPITTVVLVTLLLGEQALSQIPIVMIAAVVGLVTAVSLDRKDTIRPLKARAARNS